MSMSSSEVESQEVPVPIQSFSYRDIGTPVALQANETRSVAPVPEPPVPMPAVMRWS